MEEVKLMVIGIVLIIQSVCDIKWKKIPLVVTGIGFLCGIVLVPLCQTPLLDVLLAVLPGSICMLFAKASRQAIGYGDACLLCTMGLFYSIEEMIWLMVAAFGLAGIAALVLIVFFKKKRKYEMAFVPFLAAAYTVDIWMRMEGMYL